jgi:hypothetical protein
LNEVIDRSRQKAIAYIGEHIVKLDSFGSFNDKFVVEHSFFKERERSDNPRSEHRAFRVPTLVG